MKWRKTVLVLLILYSACAVMAQQGRTKVDKRFHVYLLVGQSNMAGRGYVDSLSKVENPRIKMLNKEGEWVPATDPLHFDKKIAGVGPGLAFAQQMLNGIRKKKVTIGLIPCAVGGTSIDKWTEGAFDEATGTHPYDDAMVRAKKALRKGVLKGILWHQGESDAAAPDTYPDKLSVLVDKLRKQLDADKVPFVVGELGYFNDRRIAFNQMLQAVPVKISNTAVVSAEGLTANEDNIHFNTASARELGRRYAIAMKSLQGK